MTSTRPAVAGEIIACANQKGGVGKTTTVVNVAAYLALHDCRVVIIDLDPQGNATSGVGARRGGDDASLYELMTGDATLEDASRSTDIPGLTVIPSALSLAGLEVELVATPRRERLLRQALEPLVMQHDFIFVDCPPSLGLLTVNALTAADSVLVPIQCEYYALEGLSQLMETIALVRDHLNPRLEVRGILLTMYDPRTKLSADVADEVRTHFGEAVFHTVVPRAVRLSEAPSYGQPIPLYHPSSKGARAYERVTQELLARSRAEALSLPTVEPPLEAVSA